ncbi:MAG: lytic transglycosylase domain-containing protein [Desulfomonilaceae bacterium]
MILKIAPVLALLLFLSVGPSAAQEKEQPNALAICSVIINEMTEGRLSLRQSYDVASAIAHAANKYFHRVTCGDMWLYMAIVYVESGFKNNIVNYKNCRGMFQVHAPSWASKFSVRYADLLDLRVNAECGVQIFKYYLELYGNVIPALSAYNSDHPHAARGYARAVLSERERINKRYIQLYNAYRDSPMLAAVANNKISK